MTPWTAAHQASLSFTVSRSLLKLMSIESVMPSNHLILCRPLLPLPSIFSSIRVFSNESVLCIRWPKYWSFLRVGLRLQGRTPRCREDSFPPGSQGGAGPPSSWFIRSRRDLGLQESLGRGKGASWPRSPELDENEPARVHRNELIGYEGGGGGEI